MKNNSPEVIIFSKDRPWQLEQLLRTIKKYTDFDKINVLVKFQNPYIKNYNRIYNRFSDIVNFYEEKDSFKESFFEIYDSCNSAIAFMVDDVVFYDNFSSLDALSFMIKEPVFSYQFKMNPKYDFCQTAGKDQRIPKSLKKSGYHWTWESKDGTWDWDYPFDLTGSIYFKEDIKFIMDHIRESEIINPNYIEGNGAEICQNVNIADTGKPLMACQDTKVCACLAVNLVNPHKRSEWSCNSEVGLLHLNKKIFGKFDYDEEFIRSYNQKSVHITSYKLRNKV
jgi:hypothetical protein